MWKIANMTTAAVLSIAIGLAVTDAVAEHCKGVKMMR